MSRLFFVGLFFLSLKSSLLSASRRLCGPPLDGGSNNRPNHLAQPIQAVGDVSGLVAIPLTVQNQHSIFADAIGIFAEESLSNAGRKRFCYFDIPVHNGLGIHFVHVLTTGASASREREFEFGVRNLDVVVNVKHGGIFDV